MHKWHKIQAMSTVRKTVLHNDTKYPTKVYYRAKIKLHGTNAPIQVDPDGTVHAFSRTREIRPGKEDNAGFAAWVDVHKEYFSRLKRDDGSTLVIYGEWCGTGIQNGVSLTQIGKRVYAVFAAKIIDTEGNVDLITEPIEMYALLPEIHDAIFVIPYMGPLFNCDWSDPESCQAMADRVNEMVDEIDKCDPWVKAVFDVEGPGEGVVMYPIGLNYLGPCDAAEVACDLMWKAKGAAHHIVKAKAPAMVDPEVLASIEAFVNMFVTEARLQQGLAEACGGDKDRKNTGKFLKWISQDVESESREELAGSGLTWKKVNKAVSTRARQWFFTDEAF